MPLPADDNVYVPGEWVLTALIEANGDDPRSDGAVRRIIADGARLLALGEPAGNGRAHLLRCTVPVGGNTIAMLPVFTGIEDVAAAVAMNPSWGSLHVLGMDSRVILDDLRPGEWLGINPWSGREFKLPPRRAAA